MGSFGDRRTEARVPGCGMYDFQSEDFVKAVKELAPLLDDLERLEDHMVNDVCLWEGSERVDSPTDAEYIEHAIMARAWQIFCTRTGA